MRVGRWLIFIFALLATTVGTGAPEARAQGYVAKKQFRDAKKLYDNEKYQDALQMFQLAWEQSYSPNARLYIGRCFVKLGNLRTGYDELRATLREAHTRSAEDKKYLNTRNAAAAELALLEPRLGRLIVLLDDRVEGATVTLDGKPLAASKLEEPLTFEPKTVTLVASAEGRDDVKRSVNIGGGRTIAVAMLFPPVAGAPVSAGGKPDSTSAPEQSDGYTILQYLGFVAIGLGGATLVLAAASGAAAASRQAALDQACGGARCTDPAFGDVVDTGKQFETLAYIGLGVGAAAALGGVALVLFGGESEDDEEADSAETAGGQSAAVIPLPGGAAFSYQLRF